MTKPRTNDKFIAQAKMLRVFQLMELLVQAPYNTETLSDLLDVSVRTTERYIDLLEAIGFEIVKTPNGGYKLGKCPAFMKRICAQEGAYPGDGGAMMGRCY